MNKIPLTPEQKEDFAQLAIEIIAAIGMKVEDRNLIINRICQLIRNQELLAMAWALIANASGGDWTIQSLDWQNNAMQWRQCYVGFLQSNSGHDYYFDMIEAELQTQKVNGYTEAHDDEHDKGELAEAGAAYALGTISQESREQARASVWPFEPTSYSPKNPARDLVRSIAFLVAELKRFERKHKIECPDSDC